jgi:hypothetical protein
MDLQRVRVLFVLASIGNRGIRGIRGNAFANRFTACEDFLCVRKARVFHQPSSILLGLSDGFVSGGFEPFSLEMLSQLMTFLAAYSVSADTIRGGDLPADS